MPADSGEGSEEVVMAKFEAYKTEQKRKGESILLNVFPRKVLELNDLIKPGGIFDYANLDKTVQSVNIPTPEQLMGEPPKKRALVSDNGAETKHTKVYTCVTGRIPLNSEMAKLIDTIKPLLRDAIEHMNQVKVWILLLMPRIEDGNNFGVGIQEEVLSEVRTIESEAASFLDQTSRYFLTRAKLVTKVARFPHIDDYRRSITDLDEKQFINLRLTVAEVRNHYTTLHDLVIKNLDKIRTPRTNTAMESMY